jgi:PAS domain S-box-containing protein
MSPPCHSLRHALTRDGQVLLLGVSPPVVDRMAAALAQHAPALTLAAATAVDEALASLESVDCLVVGDEFDGPSLADVVETVHERDPVLPVVVIVETHSAAFDTVLAAGVTDVVSPDAPGALLAARLGAAVGMQSVAGRGRDANANTTAGTDRTLDDLKLRALDDADMGVVITESTADTPVVFANAGFGRLTGYAPETFVGRNCRILQGPDTATEPVESIRTALSMKDPVSVVLRNYRQNGTPFWNEVDIEPITDDDGSVTHYLGFQRDVSERVALRIELDAARESLRGLYTVTTDASLSLDERIERTLALACERLDVDIGFVTRLIDDTQHIVHSVGGHPLLQPGEACPLSESYCRRTLDTEGLLVVGHAAADDEWANDPGYERFGLESYLGGKIHVDDELYGTLCFADTEPRDEPFTESQTAFIELLTRWVSYELERKQHEHELRTATRRFRALFDNPRTFAGVLDPDGTLREANETARSTLSAADSVLGRPFWETRWWTPDEESVETVREAVETAAAGEVASFECAYFHQQGSGTVGVTIYPVYGTPVDDLRFDEHEGEPTEVVSLIAIGTDTTTRTDQAEQLRQQRDRLDEFAAVVSHDLRSPLEVARGRLHLYDQSGDEEHIEQSKQSLDRMSTLIDDLLELARQGATVSDPVSTSVTEVARRAWSTVATGTAALTTDLDPDVTVDADPTRLRQLFENLFRNSVEHGSTSNRPAAGDSVAHGSTDGADPVTVRLVALDGTRGFAVEDDGIGIDPADRPQVFESGFTTATGGTGFGLAIVGRVVEAHGWEIGVTEGTAGGARFEVSVEPDGGDA